MLSLSHGPETSSTRLIKISRKTDWAHFLRSLYEPAEDISVMILKMKGGKMRLLRQQENH